MTAPIVTEGFCRLGRKDEPMGPDHYCLEHRELAIAPTWGSRTWAWDTEAGTWRPYVPRPEGYVYRPRFPDEPTPKQPKKAPKQPRGPRSLACRHCSEVFVATYSGGDPPRYCSSRCKNAALCERRRLARRAAS